MVFICKKFEELSSLELYKIIQLRITVFVVEQNCVYQDLDNKDLSAYHCMLLKDSTLIGTTRLLARGISYDEYPSIGRVCTLPTYRGTGAGKRIMEESLKIMKSLFPGESIKISAQSYLIKFYNDLGFEAVGEDYLEDNIPHRAMIQIN